MDKADMAELGCRRADCVFALQMRNLVKGYAENGWVRGSVSVPVNSTMACYTVGVALNSVKKGEAVQVQMFGSVSDGYGIDCAKTIGPK